MTTRFPAGTFTPAPQLASMPSIIFAQAKLETTLIWRHGEQMLLSVVIPLAMLIGFTLVPILDHPDPLQAVFPMVLSIAVMSAGFTGQAIAVGFDRRYGALKRIGASALPKWGIICGKIIAVAVTVSAQYLIFTIVGLILGLDISVGGWIAAYVVMLLGTATFSALGLLMGGTLTAELILGLANLIWFLLLGAATFAAVGPELSDLWETALGLLPSVALMRLLEAAMHGGFDLFGFVVLIVWAVIAASLAIRLSASICLTTSVQKYE